ncbi:DUF4864 domain-containing protein [Phyllobacterium sp. SB3]|uniref:DUF4864 domain-containing protein n=1 Tax=Phyllobacterium sp. SB3 TaxID=3156073 RepID=UPI0032AED7E1
MVKAFGCFIAAVLLSLGLVGSIYAQESPEVFQSIIKNQIAAFLNDDAKTAYSFASPSIQGKFPNQNLFFEMVKKAYQPVYRPGNFAFGRSKAAGDQIIQEVLITGPDGKDSTAIYLMQKQPDGSYKINGVQILQTTVGPAI